MRLGVLRLRLGEQRHGSDSEDSVHSLTMSLVYMLIVIAPLGLCLCAERPAAFEECAYARTALLVTLLFQLAFDMHQAFLELDVRRMCLSHFLLAHLRGTQRLFGRQMLRVVSCGLRCMSRRNRSAGPVAARFGRRRRR